MGILRKIMFLIPLLSAMSLYGREESFQLGFIHREGEVIHADSLVDETVYVDGYLSHQAEVDEFSVTAVREVAQDGSAVLDADFRTVERVEGYPGSLEWVSSETVRLERETSGELKVPDDAFRPVLRHVPRFPETPVKPGDSWSFPAEEVHVFRIGGQIWGPYRGPAQVLYTYMDNETSEDRLLARIGLEYSIHIAVRGNEPVRMLSGHSRQEVLWDIGEGRPVLKTEDFEFFMLMADGRTQEFRGSGKTTYRRTQSLDRARVTEDLKSDLAEVPGIKVTPAEEGIRVSVEELDTILFEPESAVIREDQKKRLAEVARILSRYPDRDILITGHTADYGSFDGRRALSFERADAVGRFLFPGGRPGPGRLFLRGAGNTEPLGSDRADRRVEILILD